jgi:hypothetical protein
MFRIGEARLRDSANRYRLFGSLAAAEIAWYLSCGEI